MKQLSIATILTLIAYYSYCQESDLPKIVKDTLFTSIGYKIVEGEKIKLGSGTMPDGDFKYIRISSSSIFSYTGTDQTKVNAANSLNRNQSGHTFKVVKLNDRGSKKRGYTYYAFINLGITRYEIDVEPAIATGELEVPSEFKAVKTESQPKLSIADEIKKLKDLLDSGAITQEEYDAQKKKLLGN